MMKRYRPEELFEVNKSFNLQMIDVGGAIAIVIDDFYKNPHDIRTFILNTPVPIWKNTPDGLNWIEYYDCRHQIFHATKAPWAEPLYSVIDNYFTREFDANPFIPFITNVFQWIIDQPKNSIGNRVHADGKTLLYDNKGIELEQPIFEGTIGSNIYFNTPDECHGGTAFYRSKLFDSNHQMGHESDYIKYMEGGSVNRGETGAQYYDTEWEEFWSIQQVIPMAFNRCVMYDGGLFHGAYHVDNNFKDFPRLGQSCFTSTGRR